MPDVFISEKQKTKTKSLKSQISEKKTSDLKISKKVLSNTSGKDTHPLSAFRFYPAHADFLNKDPEEKVILLLRRHPITNFGWIVLTFIMIIVPAFITVLPFFETLPAGFQIISLITWYVLTAAFAFEKFVSWFYNVNIITDERIFDIDFLNLIYREITDADIGQIQDVTVEVGGPLRTVLNFGDVMIQTAAEVPHIEFESVPQPDKVARILRELRIEEEIEELEGRVR